MNPGGLAVGVPPFETAFVTPPSKETLASNFGRCIFSVQLPLLFLVYADPMVPFAPIRLGWGAYTSRMLFSITL